MAAASAPKEPVQARGELRRLERSRVVPGREEGAMLLHLVPEFDLRRDVVPWLAARGWAAALGNAAAGGAAPAGSAAAGPPAPWGGPRTVWPAPTSLSLSVRCPPPRAEEPGLR